MAKLSYIKFRNIDNVENAKLIGISEIENATNFSVPAYIDGIEISEISSNLLNQLLGISVIDIPSTITKIGDSDNMANIMQKSISSINVSSHNSVYASIDGVLYDKHIETLLYYPAAKQNKVFIIPDTVTVINSKSFNANPYLEEIIIKGRRKNILSKAFCECPNLQIVNISCSNILFENDSFSNCQKLTTIRCFGMHRYINEDGVLYYREHTGKRTMIFYAHIKDNGSYSVHPDTTAITSFCFNRTSSLRTLHVPANCRIIKNTIPSHINIIRDQGKSTVNTDDLTNQDEVKYSIKDHNVSRIKTYDINVKKNRTYLNAQITGKNSNSTRETINWLQPKFNHPFVLFEGTKREFNSVGTNNVIVFANGYRVGCKITANTVYIKKKRIPSDMMQYLEQLNNEHRITILQTTCIRSIDEKDKKKKINHKKYKGYTSFAPFRGSTTNNNIINGARVPGARNHVHLWS